MSSNYDAAVIGLGAMGSATLWQLARLGLRVVGIDRFAPPHALGSSHGESRVTRLAIGEGEHYVPFVLRSHEIWKEIEAATGKRVLEECGFLLMTREGPTAAIHGKENFFDCTLSAASRHGIAHEVIGGAEIAQRFPQFTGLQGDERGYFEPGGGYVRPELAIETQLALATAAGAEIRTGEVVTSIATETGGLRLTTSRSSSISVGHAIISAGPWATDLLSPIVSRHLKIYRQTLHWFPLQDAQSYARREAPVFIRIYGPAAEDQFYGFPPLPGAADIKIADESYGQPTSPDVVIRDVSPEESAVMFRRHARGRVADVGELASRASVCCYTSTPDGDFIIDRHPDHARAIILSACSGHGFKHSAALGEAVAKSVSDGRLAPTLAPFHLQRFLRAVQT